MASAEAPRIFERGQAPTLSFSYSLQSLSTRTARSSILSVRNLCSGEVLLLLQFLSLLKINQGSDLVKLDEV